MELFLKRVGTTKHSSTSLAHMKRLLSKTRSGYLQLAQKKRKKKPLACNF